jgi:sensor c-di-GMP phosphodiesterase-like protein
VGGEALVRWQREGEVVYPMDFVPHVESTALSGMLTYWVLDQVAKELLPFLKRNPSLCISVNVPPEVFGRGGIQYVMRHSGLSEVAPQIMLELTERGLLDKVGLSGVYYAGRGSVKIALDDVNTHDSALLLLSRAHANTIKLDTDFADNMLKPGWDPGQLDSIKAIVRTSDLQVIAEGISSEKQVKILRDAGIQLAQGWLFSPSLAASRFMQYCEDHPVH